MRVMAIGAVLVWAAGAPALAAAPVDNERVSVTDLVLAKGQAGPTTPHGQDVVIMFLEGARIRRVTASGHITTRTYQFGDAVFLPRGSDAVDTVVSGGPAHEVVVALKDGATAPARTPTRLPPAFPRAGSVKVLDNKRVVVWRYSWRPQVATPMHFHDKDVVVAYRYDGALRSTSPDRKSVVNDYKAGEIRFNRANRAHSELLVSRRQSAVMMELK